MEIVAVAAVSENGVIGSGRKLPWELHKEVERYRERVDDDVVLLGRKTFEMFDDLPGITQLVLSRDEYDPSHATAVHVSTLTEALETARQQSVSVLYVLGGGSVYEACLPYYDQMVLSRVDREYDGDAWFPEFDRSVWRLADETRFEGYTLENWVREGQ